jgi:hypothetical protein
LKNENKGNKTTNKNMVQSKKIKIEGAEIAIIAQNQDDYISLTDMAKSQLQDVVIIKWLSLKGTIEYLGEWEALYNPNFNYTEYWLYCPIWKVSTQCSFIKS